MRRSRRGVRGGEGARTFEGYTVRVRRSQRGLVIITGILCLAVSIGFAMSWEEAAIGHHLHRLRTEPDYLLGVVIERLDREEQPQSWASVLGSEYGYRVELLEHDTSCPKGGLAWLAARRFLESEEGMQAWGRVFSRLPAAMAAHHHGQDREAAEEMASGSLSPLK